VPYLFLAKLPCPAAGSDRMATVPPPVAELLLGEKVPQPVAQLWDWHCRRKTGFLARSSLSLVFCCGLRTTDYGLIAMVWAAKNFRSRVAILS
jgi:hypothetical protein